MTHDTIMGSSLEDGPMTLVSSWLISAGNSKEKGAMVANERGAGK